MICSFTVSFTFSIYVYVHTFTFTFLGLRFYVSPGFTFLVLRFTFALISHVYTSILLVTFLVRSRCVTPHLTRFHGSPRFTYFIHVYSFDLRSFVRSFPLLNSLRSLLNFVYVRHGPGDFLIHFDAFTLSDFVHVSTFSFNVYTRL